MKRVYISGPMTGKPELNFPAFNKAAAELRAAGFDVINPAEIGEVPGLEWADYMRADIRMLMDCDTVATLPDWKKSKGARLEVHIAGELGMTVYPVWLLHGLEKFRQLGRRAAAKRVASQAS